MILINLSINEKIRVWSRICLTIQEDICLKINFDDE